METKKQYCRSCRVRHFYCNLCHLRHKKSNEEMRDVDYDGTSQYDNSGNLIVG